MNRIIAIIPARGGSKGIPRKNVKPLAGKPFLAWTVEAALTALGEGNVYVSTDDAEIAAVTWEYGAEVVQRPPEISGDAATSESALLHALECLEERDGYSPDLLVFLQCTSPLTFAEDIEATIQRNYSDAPAGLSNPAVQRRTRRTRPLLACKEPFSLPRGLDLAIQAERGE